MNIITVAEAKPGDIIEIIDRLWEPIRSGRFYKIAKYQRTDRAQTYVYKRFDPTQTATLFKQLSCIIVEPELRKQLCDRNDLGGFTE